MKDPIVVLHVLRERIVTVVRQIVLGVKRGITVIPIVIGKPLVREGTIQWLVQIPVLHVLREPIVTAEHQIVPRAKPAIIVTLIAME